MILLAGLALLGGSATSSGPSLARSEDDPPVRLWMNNDRRYREGDRVRLQVDSDVNGFLLVLNFDPTGRVRILFPLDPRDDNRVEAGRRYEVRGPTTDASFRAAGDGTGLIYTAVSAEPWRFDEIVLADRWDYTRLEVNRATTDPEADLTDIVQRLAGPGGFDYDVLGYRVYGESSYADNQAYSYGPSYFYDSYDYCNSWSWRYNGCRRWPLDGWAFGVGLYYPYYYGYSPYRYGYRYSYPYYPNRPGRSAPAIIGRSRGYTIQPRGNPGSGRFGPSISGPSRRPGGNVVAPPARRARGNGDVSAPARDPSNRGFTRGNNDSPRGRAEPPRRPPEREPQARRDPPRDSGPRQASPPQNRGNGGGNSGGHSRPRRP